MTDATTASSKAQTDCENRLYKNVVGAKREFDVAAEARCKLACECPYKDSDSARARQAFDQEQRALEKYIQALRQYNDFVTEEKVPEEDIQIHAASSAITPKGSENNGKSTRENRPEKRRQ